MMGSLVVIFLFFLFLLNGVHRLRDHQRFAVFRLGRFLHVTGPGWVFLIPIVDQKKRIDLDRAVPGWRGMAREELAQKIKTIAPKTNRRSP